MGRITKREHDALKAINADLLQKLADSRRYNDEIIETISTLFVVIGKLIDKAHNND